MTHQYVVFSAAAVAQYVHNLTFQTSTFLCFKVTLTTMCAAGHSFYPSMV